MSPIAPYPLVTLPSLPTCHAMMVLFSPANVTPKAFSACLRVGWINPTESVVRDMIRCSSPSQFHMRPNRTSALGVGVFLSSATCHVLPPSVDTSTLATLPIPDQARPVISYHPLSGSFCEPDGEVMTDFGPHCRPSAAPW